MAISSSFTLSLFGTGKKNNIVNLNKGFGIDLGDSWLMGPDENGEYTVPGTLIATFTSSGTFNPPAGTSKVNVVIIGGGGNGAGRPGGGGAGGTVRVYRDVPVSGSVSVTIGGANTASSFGSLTAPGGGNGGSYFSHLRGLSGNRNASAGGGATAYAATMEPGQSGVLINGTRYSGGGGGGCNAANSSAGGGGAGGGAGGGGSFGFVLGPGGNGANGLGGGGGGGGSSAGSGGSGRVMVYKE